VAVPYEVGADIFTLLVHISQLRAFREQGACVIDENSVPTEQRTQSVSGTRGNCQLLFREIFDTGGDHLNGRQIQRYRQCVVSLIVNVGGGYGYQCAHDLT
jgi:hypothetical protein